MWSKATQFVLAALAVLAVVTATGGSVANASTASTARTQTYRHYTWKTKHFIFHKYHTKRGWKVSRVRIMGWHTFPTYKRHRWRHCWLHKSRRPHIKCNRWHVRIHKRHIATRRVGYVLPWFVVRCESGGSWTVVNRTPAGAANGFPGGAYQITRGTWAAYGGLKYAPNAESAPPYAQNIIALRVLHGQGPRAWACWT